MMFINYKHAIFCFLIQTTLISACDDFGSRQEQRKIFNDNSNLTPEEMTFDNFSDNRTAGKFDFGNHNLCFSNSNIWWQTKQYCSMLLNTTNDPLLFQIYVGDAFVDPPMLNEHVELYDPVQNMNSKPVTRAFILLCVLLSFVSTIILFYRKFSGHIFLKKPRLNPKTDISASRKQNSIPSDSKTRIRMQSKSEKPQDIQAQESEHVIPNNPETRSLEERITSASARERFLPPSNDN